MAQRLYRLPYSQLLEYGITSYRDITGLDTIGIPVWVAYRPPSTTVSVTAGKNPDPILACAGCITEAIEFWAAEHPNTNYKLTSYELLAKQVQSYKEDPKLLTPELLPLRDYPLARDNIVDESTALAWELVECLRRDATMAWMPSNLVWLIERSGQQFQDVQQSSNGLASGTSLEDAVLQGLYEVIERDGWTTERFVRDMLGLMPKKIPLKGLPEEMAWSVGLMRQAGYYPFLFDCTVPELGIPVIGCALFDRGEGVGLFGGYGCSLSPRVAAQRALLEAAQSRLCYISGARDDFTRRDFILMKRTTQAILLNRLEVLEPLAANWRLFAEGYDCLEFANEKQELLTLIQLLHTKGIDKLYYRLLRELQIGDGKLSVVKVIAPQLEGVWCDEWVSNGRAIRALNQQATKSHERSA